MGVFAVLMGLLSACGDSSLEELQQHPLANPNVTVMEPSSQTATSGDISTGVFNGSSTVNRVATYYDHDDTPEQRDRIVQEIIDHAEEIGCNVSLSSLEELLPYVKYSVGCEGFGSVLVEVFVSPSSVSVELMSGA